MTKWNLTRVKELLRDNDPQAQRPHHEKSKKSIPPHDDEVLDILDQGSLKRIGKPFPKRPILKFIPHRACNSEILQCIAEFLSLEDFRNFRLVNGTMYNATIHLFVRDYFKFQTIEFTLHGLQCLINISKHQDLSKSVLFGSRIRFVSFTQAVWSENEARIWFRAILKSRSLNENRVMVEGALKARNLWRSHKNMLSRNLYLSMLTTFFQSVNGTGQFRGFNFVDRTPMSHQDVSRTLPRAAAIEKCSVHIQKKGWIYIPTSLERTTQFSFTMEMCFRAMRATNTLLLQGVRRPGPDNKYKRHHINLRQLTGVMDRHEATPDSFSPWQYLERCTVLGISFCAISRSDILSLNDQQSFTRLITPMSQTLTVLNLHATCRLGVMHSIVHELAQNVFMPKLEHLTLDRGTSNYKDLTKLVTKHSESLKYIAFQFLGLPYDSWSNVFLTLANTPMPKLNELWFRYPAEGDVQLDVSGNGTYTPYNMRRVSWPITGTTDTSATYARMRESFGDIDGMTSDELIMLMPHTPYFQFLKPFGQVGAQRLHWMVANMVYENV